MYLLMETPWLVGSGLSIVIDAALMYCIRRWRRNYYRDSNPKWLAKKAEREEHAKLAQGLDAEIEEREEEGLLIDILTDVNMYRREGAPAAVKLGFWARLFGDPDLEAYKERKVVAENFNTRRHDHHILDLLHRIETRHRASGRWAVALFLELSSQLESQRHTIISCLNWSARSVALPMALSRKATRPLAILVAHRPRHAQARIQSITAFPGLI